MISQDAPRATYRLQLRNGMTFGRAGELAPYLAALGISHLYLSPIFKAVPGSTHGYDAVDFNLIEPELGGYEGFASLARTMQASGIALLLDIVPNHMGANPLNSWWREALEFGEGSQHAQHFDVDWNAPHLLVPRLADHYGEVLHSGGFRFEIDDTAGELSVAYNELQLPLKPQSYAAVLGGADGEQFASLALKFASVTAASAPEIKQQLAAALAAPAARSSLNAAAERIAGDWKSMHGLLEQQVWRLAHWRTARENLTYRRFFEIAELVGVRVEQPNVFDDVHRTVLQLVREGFVQGLRIDHIDGLADPRAYLSRLRDAIGRDGFYVVVEKILGHGESLRKEWPVAGTTGYETINALALLLADGGSRAELDARYAEFIGEERNPEAAILRTKQRTLTRNLAGELDHLTHIAADLAQGDIATRDFGKDTLRRAIVEVASCLPVYRTYVDSEGASEEDKNLVSRAVALAKTTREVEDLSVFDFLSSLFALELGSAERRAAALSFTKRFQQTSGPLMAKALEDTFFYRFNRLIALNEVGGEPGHPGGSLDAFHETMTQRQARSPLALSATATHDTKRGEDSRARLYTISEDPRTWSGAVCRWSALNSASRSELSGVVPDRDFEWMFYQSLLGAWPPLLRPSDTPGMDALTERLSAFMRKAAREAKLHTSWTAPDEPYERELDGFVRRALSPTRSAAFLDDFVATAQPFLRAGAVNSLTQLLVKLFAPGIPDVYQGSELWDLALVDPDNRRPVDYARRVLPPAGDGYRDLLAQWRDGRVKMHLLRAGLGARKQAGAGFSTSSYVPLHVQGTLRHHAVAFARAGVGGLIVVAGTRLALKLLDTDTPKVAPELWRDTAIRLPTGAPSIMTDAITGRSASAAGGELRLSEIFAEMPVAALCP